mgnify:CR=1 FL=1
MKKSLVILGLICTQFINAQKKLKSIDTLDLNKIRAEDVSKKYKNGFDVEVITLKDGTITQKGSDFIIGSPSNPENINNKRIIFFDRSKIPIESRMDRGNRLDKILPS